MSVPRWFPFRHYEADPVSQYSTGEIAINLTVNGTRHDVVIEPWITLLDCANSSS